MLFNINGGAAYGESILHRSASWCLAARCVHLISIDPSSIDLSYANLWGYPRLSNLCVSGQDIVPGGQDIDFARLGPPLEQRGSPSLSFCCHELTKLFSTFFGHLAHYCLCVILFERASHSHWRGVSSEGCSRPLLEASLGHLSLQ